MTTPNTIEPNPHVALNNARNLDRRPGAYIEPTVLVAEHLSALTAARDLRWHRLAAAGGPIPSRTELSQLHRENEAVAEALGAFREDWVRMERVRLTICRAFISICEKEHATEPESPVRLPDVLRHFLEKYGANIGYGG